MLLEMDLDISLFEGLVSQQNSWETMFELLPPSMIMVHNLPLQGIPFCHIVILLKDFAFSLISHCWRLFKLMACSLIFN